MKDFLNKKNIINLLLLGIMIMAIPLTAKLARQQQILFSHAAEQKIEFLTKDQGGSPTPDNKSCVLTRKVNGVDKPVTLCKEIKVKFTAPTGSDIRLQSRTSLLPQEGFIKKAYATEYGECENGSYRRGYNESTGLDDWDDCVDQGKDCVNGQGCVDATTPGPNHECASDGDRSSETGPSSTANCEGHKVCHYEGDTLKWGGYTCESCTNGASNPPSCDNQGDTPGPNHECASDGDRSSETGPSSTANCEGHKVCHYEGDTLKWGGYTCESCTNGASNPPSCDNQGGTPASCTIGAQAIKCGGSGVDHFTCDGNTEPDSEGWSLDDNGHEDCTGGAHCVQSGNTASCVNDVVNSCTAPVAQCYRCNANTGRYDRLTASGSCTTSSPCCSNGDDSNQPCRAATQPGADPAYCPTGNTPPANACRNNPVTPPDGYKWTANCSGSVCTDNNECPKGANNQDGWCYGFTGGKKCLKLETTGQGSPGEGSCKDNPVTPPSGYKWAADCSKSCIQNSECPKGANNQDGWCYGFTGGKKCLKLETTGQGSPGEGSCKDNPVTPPSGYKWAADCSKSCIQNSECPKGANNQDGWCYGFTGGKKCLKLESIISSAQKCFVCRNISGQNKWVYPGANESGSGGNENATCSDAENSCNATSNKETCKGPVAKLSTACVGMAPQITKIRFSDDRNKVETAEVKNYQEGGENIFPVTFADNNPGQKFVWVQFGDNNGNWTEAKNKEIFLAGPDPLISGAACNLDLKDNSLKFQVIGDNFGDKDASNSKLAADTSNLEIKEWTNQKVIARFAAPPDTTTGKTFTVNLTRSDGVRTSATCSVNTTQISLGAKLFCRGPRDFDQDNVKLLVVQNALGIGTTGGIGGNFKAGDKQRETVTITKEGVINLKTKLQLCEENGQDCPEYKVCLKAPKSVRVCSKNKFKAINGNMIIQNLELPLCDTNDDGKCNSTDASRCKAEWGPGKGNKSCEFNRDNVTNSFEWGCLIHDFNSSDEEEPS